MIEEEARIADSLSRLLKALYGRAGAVGEARQALRADRLLRVAYAAGRDDERARLIEQHLVKLGCSVAERETALLCLRGKSNREIASTRGVSVETTNRQLDHVYRKAGVKSRAQLAALFIFGREDEAARA